MPEIFKYDVFIAYAGKGASNAKQLHDLLSTLNYKVFLDSEALIAGDPWPQAIRQAQQDSQVFLVLISDQDDSAYFQQHEILIAIDMAQEDPRRRVLPVYLMTKKDARNILRRHPLKQLQGIFWEEGSLLHVAQQIEAAMKVSKRHMGPGEIILETIVIVTGCYHRAELFDRPSAYELKMSIDYFGYSLSRTFLPSIVMGDIWFCDHSKISGHPNVISIGSTGINNLSRIIFEQRDRMSEGGDGRWKIVWAGNRVALFGDLAEDTYDAVNSFKERNLSEFLGKVWANLRGGRR